jgi:acetyl-CoA carboxylase biotin carboxyl carrier protein
MSEQAAQPIQVNDSTEKTESNEGKGRNRKRHHRSRGHGGQRPTTSPEPAINMVELRSLIELISESGFTDFEYENADVRVRLRKDIAPQIVAAPTAPTLTLQPQTVAPVQQTQQPTTQTPSVSVPHPGAQAEAEAAEDESLYKITSPIIGTFYRSSSPSAEPFVKIGSHVSNDTVVCIVEAMKLMNEIQAETSGEVVKIYVENGQPVEYGQPLFGIKK